MMNFYEVSFVTIPPDKHCTIWNDKMFLMYPYSDPQQTTPDPLVEIEDFTSEEFWPEWKTKNKTTGQEITVKAMSYQEAVTKIQGHPDYHPGPDMLSRPARRLGDYLDESVTSPTQ